MIDFCQRCGALPGERCLGRTDCLVALSLYWASILAPPLHEDIQDNSEQLPFSCKDMRTAAFL